MVVDNEDWDSKEGFGWEHSIQVPKDPQTKVSKRSHSVFFLISSPYRGLWEVCSFLQADMSM